MGKNELTDLLFPVLQEGAKGYASWKLFPEYPTLKHYVEVLLDSPEFFVMFWNSVKITAGALAGFWLECLLHGDLPNLIFQGKIYCLLCILH